MRARHLLSVRERGFETRVVAVNRAPTVRRTKKRRGLCGVKASIMAWRNPSETKVRGYGVLANALAPALVTPGMAKQYPT